MAKKKDVEPPQTKEQGTAIVITGAAAKISQEAALLERLYNQGMLNNVVFISGASSGGLNAVVLNGILSGKITWKEYREFLSKLSNDDIFKVTGNKFPVDTDPLRSLIIRFISERLGYKTLSDLPIPTSLSVVNLKAIPLKERTLRLCNRKINPESDSSLSIVDVLMASTSYPIAFPPALISNTSTIPNVPYYDGGIAEDRVPFEAVVQFEKYRGINVSRMIIVSRTRDTLPISNEIVPFEGIQLKALKKMEISPETFSYRGFQKRLKDLNKECPRLSEKTFVYFPNLDEQFLMFDFSTLAQQYELTYRWAQENSPIPLIQYMKENNLIREPRFNRPPLFRNMKKDRN
ncbi:MAG: patatin-like phospholipase family protein [Bacteroidales bacterium]